jgi:hypothetical protein
MPSLLLLATGLVLLVACGYGVLYPQRQYAIRQRVQTADDPTLSPNGKLLWRLLNGIHVLLGVGIVWLAFTV